MSNDKKKKFEDAASEKDLSLVAEFILMLKENKKYWMIPIILILLAFGVLFLLSSTAVAPFIYTLF